MSFLCWLKLGPQAGSCGAPRLGEIKLEPDTSSPLGSELGEARADCSGDPRRLVGELLMEPGFGGQEFSGESGVKGTKIPLCQVA